MLTPNQTTYKLKIQTNKPQNQNNLSYPPPSANSPDLSPSTTANSKHVPALNTRKIQLIWRLCGREWSQAVMALKIGWALIVWPVPRPIIASGCLGFKLRQDVLKQTGMDRN